MPNFAGVGTGEVAALISSALFAFTAVLFTRVSERSNPVASNTFKVLAGSLLFVVAMLIRDGRPWGPSMSGSDFGLLALSGIIGLSVGDTLLFMGFHYIGTRRSMLLASLNPLFGALGAWWLLGERLSAMAWGGIGLALLGAGIVVADGMSHRRISRRAWIIGGLCGLGAALGQASGALAAKGPLERVDSLTATQLRVTTAALGLLLLAGVRGQLGYFVEQLKRREILAPLALASVLGPFLSIWLMLVALQHAPTGVALALLSTSPLFLLPLGAIMQGDRPSAREGLGAMVAIGGVALLLMR